MGQLKLDHSSVEAAFSQKAVEFAANAANIFWLRDIKLPDFKGTRGGKPFVPSEKEIEEFCMSVVETMIRSFDLDISEETKSLYISLSAGRISAYIRVAPVDQENDESPIVVDMGFLLSLVAPSILPVQAFAAT